MKTSIFFLSIIVLFLSGCFADDENLICDYEPAPCEWTVPLIPYQDTCYALPPTPGPGWMSVATRQGYGQVSFNPIDSKNILYFTNDSIDGRGYFQLDLCKGEKSFITEKVPTVLYGRPLWGYNDWLILFTENFRGLYKVKLNGDSLSMINDGVRYNYNPVPLPDNRLFVLREFSSNDYKRVIMDYNGVELDTLDFGTGYSAYGFGKLAGITGISGVPQIGLVDLELKIFLPFFDIPAENTVIQHLEWFDEENLIWIDVLGLHKVNINTGVMTTIRENCDNRKISTVDVNPDFDGSIIFDELHYTPHSDTSRILYKEKVIYLFDTNTGVMQELSLDGI